MKCRRILLSVLIALFLIAQPLSCFAAVAEYYPSFETQMTRALGKEFMLKMAAQDEAIYAYETLLGSFTDSSGQVFYPDVYGGAYLDEDILHINLTDTSPETLSYFRNLLSNYLDKISLDYAPNSYNYLTSVNANLSALIDLPPASSHYIDSRNNRITVRISTSCVSPLALDDIDLPIHIEAIANPVSIPATNVIGGDSLYKTDSGSNTIIQNRAISACGWYEDEVCILTCGHDGINQLPVGQHFFLSTTGPIAATTALSNFTNNGTGDYAICYLNIDDFSATSYAKYDNDTTVYWQGGITYSLQGMYLTKYGPVGGFAGFTVDVENDTVEYATSTTSGTVSINGLTSGTPSIGTVQGGDSGGLIFRKLGDRYYLAGTLSGRHITDNVVDRIHFSPYSLIADMFTVKTD